MRAIVVFVTCPPDRAAAIAEQLVAERVAACVNILPAVQSVYRWQGQVHSDAEALLVIKTAADRFDQLKDAVLARHPYELPEVIALPITDAHAPYLDWLLGASRDAG